MGTGQTYQQLAIARLRAVEHGRWTMEAATSGVSAVIDPHGKILAQTGEYQARYLDMEVRRNTAITLADRVGAWPEYAFALLGLLAAIGLGGAATTWRRTRALIPGFRTPADTLPDAPDGAVAAGGSSDLSSMATDVDLEPIQTAAKGRAR
jgi:apolipoprotein N-acyltransferase